MLQVRCNIGAFECWKTGLAALCLAGMTAGAGAGGPASVPGATSQAALPQKLGGTGLFLRGTTDVAPELMPYAPQYPLWTDGAVKRRWLYLPPGAGIDAADPDAWQFPPGTRLWKEFGFERPVETRMIERLEDGSWRYSTYVWNEAGSDAELAPAEGIANLPVSAAPGGSYTIPGQDDCRGCHEASQEPVLGVGALQLSPDRDALAPHAETPGATHVDLRVLHERGLLRNLPQSLLDTPPRVAAASPRARAALGYLHGNCGHCHNDDGPLVELDLVLRQSVAGGKEGPTRMLETLIDYPAEVSTLNISTRVVPGSHESSMLFARMRTRNPLMQMPPLGTRVSDATALALIASWIERDLEPQITAMKDFEEDIKDE